MKKVLIILSAVLFTLSCNKTSDTMIVDLARLSADYEAKDGDMLTGILAGNYKITITSGVTQVTAKKWDEAVKKMFK